MLTVRRHYSPGLFLPELAYLSLLTVLKVDTEKYQELAQKYKITALPTVVSCHSCRSERIRPLRLLLPLTCPRT